MAASISAISGASRAGRVLAQMLLPEEVPALAETRQLLQRRHALLIEQGMNAPSWGVCLLGKSCL